MIPNLPFGLGPRSLGAGAALLGWAILVSSPEAAAQPAPEGANPPVPADCAPKAALYSGKGLKLWVLRQGALVLAENPLRPLSRDEAVVLEVVVNGRRATAYGPDMNNLRQGGSLKSVEREGREPVRWAEGRTAPAALRVVAEDGRVLAGPLAFGGCEEPPAAKAIVDRPVKAERPARGKGQGKGKGAGTPAAAGADAPPPAHLPQGALQGLSLPK